MNNVKGTRIISDPTITNQRRNYLNELIGFCKFHNFYEIELPSIEFTDLYIGKSGKEIENQMFIFQDKKDRSICLRPEATATVSAHYDKHGNKAKDVKYFYFTRCYRYERPQMGRYREFYQFGVEWLNPSDIKKANEELLSMAKTMVAMVTDNYKINTNVKRGLDYYEGDGFEISCSELGAQQQVVGGGEYSNGIGFALGFDRITLLMGDRQYA